MRDSRLLAAGATWALLTASNTGSHKLPQKPLSLFCSSLLFFLLFSRDRLSAKCLALRKQRPRWRIGPDEIINNNKTPASCCKYPEDSAGPQFLKARRHDKRGNLISFPGTVSSPPTLHFLSAPPSSFSSCYDHLIPITDNTTSGQHGHPLPLPSLLFPAALPLFRWAGRSVLHVLVG